MQMQQMAAKGFDVLVSGVSLLPWSFSRLKDYERCPYYAFEAHVKKNKSPQSPQAARGEAVHKMAEDFVKALVGSPRVKAPKELFSYSAHFSATVRAPKASVATEERFGLTARWTQTEFFRGKDLWGRGVFDLRVSEPKLVRVVDHKTGRLYPETYEQLRFYSAAALALEQKAEKAVAEAWHLDMPPATGRLEFEVTRKDAALIMKDFNARVARMVKDTKMLPKANDKCKWCHLAKRNGGSCGVGE